MILSCPNCGTRYTVAPASLPVGGRKVRCAKCGEVWRQVPEDDLGDAAFPPVPPDEAPRFDDQTLPDEPPAFDPAPPKSDRRRDRRGSGRGALIAWVVSAILLGGLVGGAIATRETLVDLWPTANVVFSALELGVEPPGEGLALAPPKAEISVKNGVTVLTLEGRINNPTDRPRVAPMPRVTVSDAKGAALSSWKLDGPAATIPPGGAATYRDERQVQPETTSVTVSFR